MVIYPVRAAMAAAAVAPGGGGKAGGGRGRASGGKGKGRGTPGHCMEHQFKAEGCSKAECRYQHQPGQLGRFKDVPRTILGWR